MDTIQMIRTRFLFAKPVSINAANALLMMERQTAARPVEGTELKAILMIVCALRKVIMNLQLSASTAKHAILHVYHAVDHPQTNV
jgi:hypothetical protein